jgi:GAF domain-containing protein
MANAKALPNLKALSRSPSSAQSLPSEAVLDALKMMLIGASLNEVLTSVTRLVEANSEGMLCSIFLLDEAGLHLRYGAAANLPEAYRAATDGVCIGPNVGSRGAAAYLRQPVFVSDILSHPNWATFRSVALQSGLRAAWSTPIMSQNGKVTQAETGEISAGNAARDEEIRRRAYEIPLARCEQPGRELDDWLQAEREAGLLSHAQAV